MSTRLAAHALENEDELALIADGMTPLSVDLAEQFREACLAEAREHGGWINPCRVTARLKDRDADVNVRRISALWSTAAAPDGYLDRTEHYVQIDGSVSRGNSNKSVALRVWRDWPNAA